MGRRNRNSKCGSFDLVSAQTTLGISLVRRVTTREGDGLVRKGKATLEFCADLGIYYYQLKGATPQAKSEEQMARPSCTVLSKSEIEAVVGLFGKSETAGLTKAERKLLDALNRETHDFVERAEFKLGTFQPRHSIAA